MTEQEQVTTLLPRERSELEKSGVVPQGVWGIGPWGGASFSYDGGQVSQGKCREKQDLGGVGLLKALATGEAERAGGGSRRGLKC